MQSSDIPVKFNIPFANNAGAGYIRPVPQSSQISIQNGAASLFDGFPSLNFLPIGAGGVPPFGQDMNGILNQITKWSRWQGAGGTVKFDQTFATAVGGYPVGAIVAATNAGGLWLCIQDNNTNNPDLGGAGWIPFFYKLIEPLNYWVAPGGSDLNPGTEAAPFQTIQKAVNQVPLFDTSDNPINIHVANGTYAGFTATRINGNGTVNIFSVSGDVNSCIIVGSGTSAFTATQIAGTYILSGFALGAGSPGSSVCYAVNTSGNDTTVQIGTTRFLNTIDGMLFAGQGAILGSSPSCTWTIDGGAIGHIQPGDFLQCYSGAIMQSASGAPPTILIPNPIRFNGSFVDAQFGSFVQFVYGSLGGAGNVTGKRFSVGGWSSISTLGGGLTYYPGTTAGTNRSDNTWDPSTFIYGSYT